MGKAVKAGNKRQRNNVSVKLCREKKKKELEERKVKTEKLKEENAALETSIEALNQELKFISEIVKSHAAGAAGGTAMANTNFIELYNIVQDVI